MTSYAYILKIKFKTAIFEIEHFLNRSFIIFYPFRVSSVVITAYKAAFLVIDNYLTIMSLILFNISFFFGTLI